MMAFWPRRFLLGLAAVSLAAGGFVGGYAVGERGRPEPLPPPPEPLADVRIVNREATPPHALSTVDFQLFWDVWSLAQRDYLRRPVVDRTLFYGALEGLVRALDDPYSVYFDPNRARLFRQELAGELEGIGAEIGIKKKQLTIIAPLPSSPAERAGLTSGDAILSIDGASTADMALEEAVARIRGAKGTIVKLVVLSRGVTTPREVTIGRDVIRVTSVSVRDAVTPGGIPVAVMTIAHFSEGTAARFQEVVRDVLARGARGVVLDLRNDPGGFLEAAIDVAGAWVDRRVVVRERGSDGRVKEFRSDGLARLAAMPTVVLVNQGTASAAEIVTGALQDYKLATVIGEPTFGKGSVQHFTTLRDGSAVKLTIAEWLTPTGRSIEGQGIAPDIAVSSREREDDRDPVLDRALLVLDERIAPSSKPKAPSR